MTPFAIQPGMPNRPDTGRIASVETAPTTMLDGVGVEWIVEARGCEPSILGDPEALAALFDRLIDELELSEVEPSVWHVFPGHGGVTGMSLLAESHLTCHTFPEHGSLCLNVFCCRPRPEWDFAGALRTALGATEVEVRRLERRYSDERRSG